MAKYKCPAPAQNIAAPQGLRRDLHVVPRGIRSAMVPPAHLVVRIETRADALAHGTHIKRTDTQLPLREGCLTGESGRFGDAGGRRGQKWCPARAADALKCLRIPTRQDLRLAALPCPEPQNGTSGGHRR